MAQERRMRLHGKPGSDLRRHSTSLMSINNMDTRAKATVKDIEELYSALQGLVPKPGQYGRSKGRATASATDSDTGKESSPSGLHRMYHSERYINPNRRSWIDDNMNYSANDSKKDLKDNNEANILKTELNDVTDAANDSKTDIKDNNDATIVSNLMPKDKNVAENFLTVGRKNVANSFKVKPLSKRDVGRSLSYDRQFVSDTEVELSSPKHKPELQRHMSLPAYEEESATEMLDGNYDTISRRSKFRLFRRRRPRPKTSSQKKKGSGWRSFFSTLSIRRKSKKKRTKNKQSPTKTGQGKPELGEQRHNSTKKQLSLPLEQKPRTVTPSWSFDLVSSGNDGTTNRLTPLSERKRVAPEPPIASSTYDDKDKENQRRNTLETKSDEVQKKLSAWYKQAVKETNSLKPAQPVRSAKSCEDLLTDTEVICARGTFSSDTDSPGAADRNTANLNRVRLRKTRARRNRRKERARWRSLPNVKLVSRALEEANQNTDLKKTARDDGDKEVKTATSTAKYAATVKPVEAKLSFGTSLEKQKSQHEPITDFMNIQKETSSSWLTRQCSKTTISCIRPLRLNLFYSESPSRESVHRSRSISVTRRNQVGDSKTIYEEGIPHEFAFKIRRTSSQRRRKRRSFRRQTRLPHQSPFYCPSGSSSKLRYHSGKAKSVDDDMQLSKDSGLGSPDSLSEKRTFVPPLMNNRLAKRYSESEDSGWASRDHYLADRADTAIQTDPVIVMTAVSKVRRPMLPHVINADNGQSEV